jgi:predicted DNA-binding protein (UPF0251 family)
MNAQNDSNAAHGPNQWPDIKARLDDMLVRLNDADRTAVTLRYLEGLEPQQVAKQMGVSQAAASKRLTRALRKLRALLRRRGVEVTADTLGAVLLAHARLSGPPALASSSVTVALSAATGGGVHAATGAMALAGKTISSMSIKVIWTAIAAVAAVTASVGIIAAVVVAAVSSSRPNPSPTVATPAAVAPSQSPAPPTDVPAPAGPIRVGILVSEFTATGPHYTSNTYGYTHKSMVVALRDSSTELYPIIEPGTQSDAKIASIIRTDFAGRTPIDGSRVEQLSTLNVIASCRGCDMRPEVLDAMESAVRDDGIGLLIWSGLATVTPGHNPQVDHLNGLQEGQYGWNSKAVECQVVAAHPILGKLSDNIGVTAQLTPNGYYGALQPGATGLIRISNPVDIWPVGEDLKTDREDFVFYPVYVSSLGKGKIVGCSFALWKSTRPIDQLVGGSFMLRSVKWLAGRAVD